MDRARARSELVADMSRALSLTLQSPGVFPAVIGFEASFPSSLHPLRTIADVLFRQIVPQGNGKLPVVLNRHVGLLGS